MQNVLLPQSDFIDPYETHARMLDESPIYYDETNGIWAVYSYRGCHAILNSSKAMVPALPTLEPGLLSEQAEAVLANLIRLSNPPFHDFARPIALQLFNAIKRANCGELLQQLLQSWDQSSPIDWVERVAKKLPALSVLSGLGFSEDASAQILPLVQDLTGLMAPIKTPQLARSINEAIQVVYPIVEKHLSQNDVCSALLKDGGASPFTQTELQELLIANCIGFLIQSYDAGRGLLSNALVQGLQQDCFLGDQVYDAAYYQQLVAETFRFDPPVQNTKRVLIEDIVLDAITLKAGETVLLVLAAANRDPSHFERPTEFDPFRANNEDHLTFGAGSHTCFARHYSTHLAATALLALSKQYETLRLGEEQIEYEPLVNVRLPKRLMISLEYNRMAENRQQPATFSPILDP